MYRAKAAGKDGVGRLRRAAAERRDRRRARGGAARCARARRVRAPLPARGRPQHERDVRRRGADPLAPRRRRRSSRPTSSSRSPSDRPDRADRALGARRGVPPGRGLARRRAHGHDSLMSRQPLGTSSSPTASIVSDVAAALERHRPARAPALPRGHRERRRCSTPSAPNRTLDRAQGARRASSRSTTSAPATRRSRTSGTSMPVDILKIDRSFVHGLFSGDEDAAIITAVVELAQRLGLDDVAEGIEEIAQAERLRQMSCAVGQGFCSAARCRRHSPPKSSSSSASINPRPPPDKPAPGGSCATDLRQGHMRASVRTSPAPCGCAAAQRSGQSSGALAELLAAGAA